MRLAPCKGCEDRHLACHATCAKYAEYTAWVKATRKAEIHEKELDRAKHDGINRLSKQRRGW